MTIIVDAVLLFTTGCTLGILLQEIREIAQLRADIDYMTHLLEKKRQNTKFTSEEYEVITTETGVYRVYNNGRVELVNYEISRRN